MGGDPNPTAPTVAIETHGCKLNQADSAALARQFARAGFRLAPFDGPASVYVINTCTVTHIADRKARQALRAIRRRSPDATIVATGCYAERAPLDLEAMAEVDIVAGNRAKDDLTRRVVEWTGEPSIPCATGDDVEVFSPRIARSRAMVKIQEGCDQICAYCIVPRVRGRERSVQPEEIVDEINRYVDSGYREVVLTGTQLGSYGFDIAGTRLKTLLERILAETSVERLRVSSLQPQDIGDDMLELWTDPRLCPHFHMPLQSGSYAVLKRMRRRYTAAAYARAVERIRMAVPDVAITTDVIAGFPGETASDHEETYALCEQVGFASAHVFPYSPRPGTSAAHFGQAVPSEVRTDRARALIQLTDRQSAAFKRGIVGQTRQVLWESKHERDGAFVWSGLTDNYVRVASMSSRELTNQITEATLCAFTDETLYAKVA